MEINYGMARPGQGTLPQLSEKDYQRFCRFMDREAGIALGQHRKLLVTSRLVWRLRELGLAEFGEYYRRLQADRRERHRAVDLLTTHTTRFFREPRYFELLQQEILPALEGVGMVRVWSAACATGEEAYSAAMVLADARGDTGWEVLASDISQGALAIARQGWYPLAAGQDIPAPSFRRHCLESGGATAKAGFWIGNPLRRRLRFREINLIGPLPEEGCFHCILLCNVMQYFGPETRARVVDAVVERLHPGGCLCLGHGENLNGYRRGLYPVEPNVYRKPLH